jgi:transposase
MKTGAIIGKITEKDGLVSSPKYRTQQDERLETIQNVKKVDIKNWGIYHLFSQLLAEEIESLKDVFGNELASFLLTAALFRWADQSPIKRMPDYYFHDFCSEEWNTLKMMNDKNISGALRKIGEDRERVVKWLSAQLPGTEAESEQFVMMDSTHAMSASEKLGIALSGHNNVGDFGPQLHLMYIFLAQKPVYFRLLPGNINDLSSMPLCVREIGVKNVVFIADKGFYSKANVTFLDKQNLQYLIPMKRDNAKINYKPLEAANYKTGLEYFIYEKRIIWYYQYEVDGLSITTYLDDKLRVEEEKDYLERIATHPESYDREYYDTHLSRFGTLSLVSKTNKAHSAEELYCIYKQRNEIEIMFDSYKNFLEADKMYMQDRYTAEGWLFANFIAMIAYYKLYSRLREAKLLHNNSPKDVIECCRSIAKVRLGNSWVTSEITTKTKKLLGKLGIDHLK